MLGAPGRRAVEAQLRGLREELAADFCIVNGENAAAGRGITAKLAERILASGADVITLGNWTWGQQGFAPYLNGADRVLGTAWGVTAALSYGIVVVLQRSLAKEHLPVATVVGGRYAVAARSTSSSRPLRSAASSRPR